MTEKQIAYYRSPIGVLRLTNSGEGLRALEFLNDDSEPQTPAPDGFESCFEQLEEYFAGQRRSFDLQLSPEGTPFQKRVWWELQNIPFGRTVSYLDIARALGNPKAIRAVGAANGRNPIPIIIPCHRVIGSDGSLIGFGGGIWRKEFLLKHERAFLL